MYILVHCPLGQCKSAVLPICPAQICLERICINPKISLLCDSLSSFVIIPMFQLIVFTTVTKLKISFLRVSVPLWFNNSVVKI